MKKAQKRKRTKVEGTATEGGFAPTAFDQIVVVNTELRKAAGLAPSEILPVPQFEMPEWGRNIVKKLCKTILKPILKLRPTGEMDWRNYGRIIASMDRYRTFYEYDVPRIIEEEFGDMTEEEWKRIEPLLGLDKLRPVLIKLLNRPVADEETFEKLADELFARQLENIDKQRQIALCHVARQGTKNTALFYKGLGEGYELILDERANFCGDRGRTNIHLNLLGCMKEVEKLRQSLPPTTRPKFYDELAKVFKMTPKAYDWFNDVCDDIKFPLNNLGRKRRSPAPIL